LCLLVIPTAALFTESVRGKISHELSLKVDPDFEPQVEVLPEDIIVVDIEGDTRFLTALQVELVMSDELKQYSEGFALAIFSSVRPPPSGGRESFEGDRIFLEVLPYFNRSFVIIPFKPDKTEEGTASTAVMGSTSIVAPESLPVLLQIQSIMKGLPDALLLRKFFIAFKPLLENRGLLALDILRPEDFEEHEVAIVLDGEKLEERQTPVELDVGIHTLQIESDYYNPETATFAINPGQTTRLSVELEPAIALLVIESPEGVSTYLDGEKLPQQAEHVRLTPGSHTVRFKVGDYSVSKTFDVRSGKEYHLSLVLGVDLKEN
jgi:hypothetical protein